MSNTLHLSAAEVARLLADATAGSRAEVAARVAGAYAHAALSPRERALAEDICRRLAHDVEVRVRAVLSDHLKVSPDVPRDVALTLARDIAEVATPMLQHSTVLTDADLVDIVRSRPAEHQAAVARRPVLSQQLAGVLAAEGEEPAVAALMANPGADVGETSLQRALDRFGESDQVKVPMVQRARLPMAVAERLVAIVADRWRDHLVLHHELPADLANELVMQSRERATVDLASGAEAPDLLALVTQLRDSGRLTPTLIVRALCTGDLNFFETALAVLGGIPAANAHLLVHDRGGLGLKTLYQHCDLPPALYPLVEAAVAVVRDLQHDEGPHDRSRFVARAIERVVTQFETGLDADNLDYLIGRLGSRLRLAAG